MERKDYLVEKLSKEEKLYLKRIAKTARNKYFEKNYNHINKTKIMTNESIFVEEESVLEKVLNNCIEEMESAVEFEKIFLNPTLYHVVKALSLKEKEVLFYLYKKKKSISEISRIMKLDRKTVRNFRDVAQKKITEKLLNGGR